jgi:uncharacterized protein
MEEKQLFKIKKDSTVFLYTKKQLEELLEIEYLFSLEFDTLKIKEHVNKLCLSAGKDGYLSKENVWFGHYYEKEIKSHFVPEVYIKWIDPYKEYGLFANEDLPNRTFLGEYTGTIRKYRKIIDDKNSYLFEYHIGYKKSPYTIDAREKGSIIRFVNHSSKPNVVPLSIYLDGAMHLIFRTNREVKKDEELTYDYGPLYWKRREKPKGE